MKTKELIRLLQKEDPEGEAECCIGNCDILSVNMEPAYYDGPLQVLERNPSSTFYNVTGAKYVRQGWKVVLGQLSIVDALCNDPKLPVDYSQLPDFLKESYKKSDDEVREVIADITFRHEEQLFCNWAKDAAAQISGDYGTVEEYAKEFFRTTDYGKREEYVKLSRKDMFGKTYYLSYNDARKEQFSREVSIKYENLDWVLSKKV